jgi:hypothetical protein
MLTYKKGTKAHERARTTGGSISKESKRLEHRKKVPIRQVRKVYSRIEKREVEEKAF